jgi:hypothetical protein
MRLDSGLVVLKGKKSWFLWILKKYFQYLNTYKNIYKLMATALLLKP